MFHYDELKVLRTAANVWQCKAGNFDGIGDKVFHLRSKKYCKDKKEVCTKCMCKINALMQFVDAKYWSSLEAR